MSQVTAVPTTTTTPPVTIMCSSGLSITTTVTVAPTTGYLAIFGQHDVVLPPQLILRDTMRGSVGLANVLKQQQPQSHMPSEAHAKYAMGPPELSFSLSQLSFPLIVSQTIV